QFATIRLKVLTRTFAGRRVRRTDGRGRTLAWGLRPAHERGRVRGGGRRMSLPGFPVEGGCQCGATRYRLEAPPLAVYNCHCRDCQRSSGGTYSMSMPVQRSNVRHLSGRLDAYDKPADSGRTVRMLSCAECGTNVWNEPLAAPELLTLKPGTLDD